MVKAKPNVFKISFFKCVSIYHLIKQTHVSDTFKNYRSALNNAFFFICTTYFAIKIIGSSYCHLIHYSHLLYRLAALSGID